MKTNLIILYCTFALAMSSSAQRSRNSGYRPGDLETRYVSLGSKDIAPPDTRLPFSLFRVIDSRFDTSKIGFIPSIETVPNPFSAFRKLKLKNGLAKSLENYYKTYYKQSLTGNDMGLAIVIKKFWISSSRDHKEQTQNVSQILEDNIQVHAKWELYIFRGDEFLPFRRIDTIVQSDALIRRHRLGKQDSRDFFSYGLAEVLNGLVEQFSYEAPVKIFATRPRQSFHDIDETNKKRFRIPILQDSLPREGVFLSFSEFKNNLPSIREFKENKMSYRAIMKEEYLSLPNDSLINNYWAYSLNNRMRITSYAHDKLFRESNSFEFFAKVRVANPRPQGSIVFKNYTTYWVPYQVDMETGMFY